MKYLFNKVLALYIIVYNRLQRDLKRLLRKDSTLSVFDLKVRLKAGSKVKSRNGTVGTVYKTYSDKQTGELRACTVVWETPNDGELMTLLISTEDLYLYE